MQYKKYPGGYTGSNPNTGGDKNIGVAWLDLTAKNQQKYNI